MWRFSVILLTVIAAACASGGGRRSTCQPVPQELRSAVRVYSECEVSRRAVATKLPSVEVPGRPEGAVGCYSAYIDVVVDSTGRLIRSSAKLVRTNNQPFADAVMRQLEEVRYEPAEKDGKRVAQLVRHKAMMQYARAVVRAGQAPPSVAATNMLPNC